MLRNGRGLARQRRNNGARSRHPRRCLNATGRELLRQLFQDHIELRAALNFASKRSQVRPNRSSNHRAELRTEARSASTDATPNPIPLLAPVTMAPPSAWSAMDAVLHRGLDTVRRSVRMSVVDRTVPPVGRSAPNSFGTWWRGATTVAKRTCGTRSVRTGCPSRPSRRGRKRHNRVCPVQLALRHRRSRRPRALLAPRQQEGVRTHVPSLRTKWPGHGVVSSDR